MRKILCILFYKIEKFKLLAEECRNPEIVDNNSVKE